MRTIDDLGLPEVVRNLAEEQRGIVLLTGTTGSGKSTTLAAMIDHINSTRSRHIVTMEDPIEYLHHDKVSIINQREVGADTQSFARAMRRVLRQDPDVILIGEMRDEETVRTALSAAETGHLVLSTLHTLDATETINRIIDFFPPHLQQQARVMLASTLRGAISQRLVPRADREGRVAVSEVMVVTGRIQDLILNPEETGRISEVIAEGDFYGMQTFDQALLGYVRDGRRLRGDRDGHRLEPARLQADARRPGPARQRHRAGAGRLGASRLVGNRARSTQVSPCMAESTAVARHPGRSRGRDERGNQQQPHGADRRDRRAARWSARSDLPDGPDEEGRGGAAPTTDEQRLADDSAGNRGARRRGDSRRPAAPPADRRAGRRRPAVPPR